jgi:hypothetical protein
VCALKGIFRLLRMEIRFVKLIMYVTLRVYNVFVILINAKFVQRIHYMLMIKEVANAHLMDFFLMINYLVSVQKIAYYCKMVNNVYVSQMLYYLKMVRNVFVKLTIFNL